MVIVILFNLRIDLDSSGFRRFIAVITIVVGGNRRAKATILESENGRMKRRGGRKRVGGEVEGMSVVEFEKRSTSPHASRHSHNSIE